MFNLPTESSQLQGSKITKFTYRQYPATRDVSGNSFSNGSQTWRWQGASNQWFLPSKSYMRFRLKITKGDGTQPDVSDDVAPAMNVCSQFYQSMNLKMGGNTISSISDYVAQCDTLKKRLRASKSTLDSLEDSKGFMDADFKVRQSKIASNGFYLKDVVERLPYSPTVTLDRAELGFDEKGALVGDNNTLAYDDTTGVFTFGVGTNNVALPNPLPFSAGDFIQLSAIEGVDGSDPRVGKPARIVSKTATTITVEAKSLGGNITTDSRHVWVRLTAPPQVGEANDALRKNEIECIWKPTLSLFDINHPMPMNCSYEMTLNPHTSETIQRRIVQSLTNKVPGTDFKVSFDQVYLYLAEVDGPPLEDSSFLLELDEMTMQTEHIDSVSFSQKNFDVSPSTKAITVFYQDERGNSGTQISDSLFRSYANALSGAVLKVDALTEEQKLRRFYLHYAGQKFPQVDWDPQYTGSKNHLTQLYIETLGASGSIFDNGGAETFQEWLERGLYLHFQTPRHGSDRSTRCSVHNEFQAGAGKDNLRLAVVSHYTQVFQVQIKSGRVVGVKNAEI